MEREFKRSALEWLKSKTPADKCHLGMPSSRALQNCSYGLVLEPIMVASNLWTQPAALLRSPSKPDDPCPNYTPVRFVRNGKPPIADRLLLAFDALVLSLLMGRSPQTGKLIHGPQFAITTVSLPRLLADVKLPLAKLMAQKSANLAPPLILNRHCPECEFQSRCRMAAVEKDDLSLLRNMTPKRARKAES
jgi:predicted RecB family nuclease